MSEELALGDFTDVPVVPTGYPDLKECLIEGTEIKFQEDNREEDGLVHVSDLSSICYREVHAKKNGLVIEKFDYASMVRMNLGTALEPWILDRLELPLDDQWETSHQGRVYLWLEGNKLTGSLAKDEIPKGLYATGSYDLLLTDMYSDKKLVVDIKTGANTKHKHHYAIQLTAYAIATSAEMCALLYFSRMDGSVDVYYFSPDQYREEVTARFKMVTMFCKPGDPVPNFGPNPWTYNSKGKSWACGTKAKPGYCNNSSCELNWRNQ